MENFHEMMKKFHAEEGVPGMTELRRLGPLAFGLHGLSKPRHSFEVRSDGTIEVRIRKGDAELIQLYDDEDDLAERNPKLFRKYEGLMSAEAE